MKKNKKTAKKGNRLNKVVKTAGGLWMAANMVLISSPVYAASQITAGLNNLKDLVITVVAGIGVIMVAKNVLEFASAYQQQDSSGMNSALKGIVGGLMMAFVGAVLTILGV